MKNKNRRGKRLKRAVPFLPNFITTISLFTGFYSIYFAINGDYVVASFLIFMSIMIDGMDGRVARATNTTSLFGKEYDSLSDLTAFGVAPAILLYLWKFSELGEFAKFGYLACCVYVACGALRLARFNSDTSGSLTTFTGLPIPIAAAGIISLVLVEQTIGSLPAMPLFAWIYLLAYLMVSTIKYPSFKHVEYIKTHPFQLLVAALLLMVVVASAPYVMFFILTVTFITGGIVWNVVIYCVNQFKHEKGKEKHETVTREDHNL